jgi:hypothetical protein
MERLLAYKAGPAALAASHWRVVSPVAGRSSAQTVAEMRPAERLIFLFWVVAAANHETMQKVPAAQGAIS